MKSSKIFLDLQISASLVFNLNINSTKLPNVRRGTLVGEMRTSHESDIRAIMKLLSVRVLTVIIGVFVLLEFTGVWSLRSLFPSSSAAVDTQQENLDMEIESVEQEADLEGSLDEDFADMNEEIEVDREIS